MVLVLSESPGQFQNIPRTIKNTPTQAQLGQASCTRAVHSRMQVFEEVANPGALYQQFYKWGLELQHKAVKSLEAGDPTAEQTMTSLNSMLEACPAGVEKHGIPLCAPLLPLPSCPLAIHCGVVTT